MNTNSVNEKLLNVLYYSPSTGISSAKKLYEKVKQRGITFQQVNIIFLNKKHIIYLKNNQELKIIFLLLLNIKMKYYK